MLLLGHPTPPVVAGMERAVRSRLGLRDVVTCTTRGQCVSLVSRHDVPVAVVAADLAPEDPVGLCAAVQREGVAVLMLTDETVEDHLPLLRAGARGIVLTTDGIEGLLLGLRQVLDGHAYVPPRLLGTLLHSLIVERRSIPDPGDRLARLSPRELEVLGLLGQGADHRDIASRLIISPHTAKTHINRVLSKLGVRSRIEAAALAVEYEIVPPEVSRA